MSALVTIGEFSRLSHLSVKTLRYYHEVGLLSPATIDDHSGYRRYATTQVDRAHLIRRLRDLDMPVADVRDVLTATDTEQRNAALRAHLDRMESALVRTQEVVASLRSLLDTSPALAVEFRYLEERPAFALRDRVARTAIDDWCAATFPLLYDAVAAAGAEPTGPGGATYSVDFFELDEGEVVAFVPVPRGTAATAGVESVVLPAGRFAVGLHVGSFEEFDRTYGALGTYVAEHATSTPDPIREHYLVGPDQTDRPADLRTELCWPITQFPSHDRRTP